MEFINCTITGSELAVSGDIPVMARGFAGIFAIKATFDSVWDDLTNHICSFKSKSGRPVSVLETDGYFTIPAEVSDAQWFDFAFTGMADDGRRITTNMVRITLKETILLGDEPEPLTPSISAQALTATEKLETRVEALEASSGGSADIADGSITTAMLADGSVTMAKIGADFISDIQNGMKDLYDSAVVKASGTEYGQVRVGENLTVNNGVISISAADVTSIVSNIVANSEAKSLLADMIVPIGCLAVASEGMQAYPIGMDLGTSWVTVGNFTVTDSSGAENFFEIWQRSK